MIQFIKLRINTSLSKTFSKLFQNLKECLPMEYQCPVPLFDRVGKLVMQVFEPVQILLERLAMYRSLKDQTVERFGNEHFEKWDKAYSFFVGLYSSGELGGGRFLAQKIK